MIETTTLNALIIGLIAAMLGILGAYLTSWEKDIYQKYFQYILPPVGVAALFFIFLDKTTSLILGFIFILGISWVYATKFWFGKK